MLITQLIERNAQIYPRKAALLDDGREQTWRELKDRIARMAAVLSARGVGADDRIALLALNSDRYMETFFSALWLGAVIVPLNTRWSIEEIRYAVNDSEASVMVVDDSFLETGETLCKLCQGVDFVINLGDKSPSVIGGLRIDTEIDQQLPGQCQPQDQNALAAICYTGGTTGFPKGVMLSQLNLWSSAVATVIGTNLQDGDIHWLHAVPMFHMAGIASFLGCSLVGATQYFIPSFEPAQMMAVIESNRISHALLVPTMIGMLLRHPDFNRDRFQSLRQITYGASPMPESTLTEVLEKIPHVDFYQGYGQTELSPAITMLGPQEHRDRTSADYAGVSDKTRSAGRACASVVLEIRDDQGQPLPSGEVGEVAVSGPNAMLGYLNRPEETQATLQNGWVLTGDAGYIDEDGYLFLVDRVKDMIVTGAENVYSAEVESVISTHPSVESVAVIGIPSDEWGEAVHAVVVTQDDLQSSHIIDHCKSRIASYKAPKSVEFRAEPLPMSAAGKILKTELRQPYWQGAARTVN